MDVCAASFGTFALCQDRTSFPCYQGAKKKVYFQNGHF